MQYTYAPLRFPDSGFRNLKFCGIRGIHPATPKIDKLIFKTNSNQLIPEARRKVNWKDYFLSSLILAGSPHQPFRVKNQLN